MRGEVAVLRRTAARYSRSVAAALIAVAALTMAAQLGPAETTESGNPSYVPSASP
ncbi:hypothetical protein AB0L85_19425 [Streptomyces sp. NPDC052051]|uniref:hypothetical protein n=1 Tax=Streptomyces sp. NPDC052051 TaxID=3154649 RepID=UPI00341D1B62